MSLVLLLKSGDGAAQFTLATSPGAFTWVGTAASPLVGRKLSAISGVRAFTGTAAALKAAYKPSLVPGAYNWLGTAATFKFGFALSVASGAYQYSGVAADFVIDYVISAGAGLFQGDWEGGPLPPPEAETFLLASRRLAQNSGTYEELGTAANLHRLFALVSVSGVHAMTGINATLLAARRIPGVSGSYDYVGLPAKAILDVFPTGGGISVFILND